MATPTSIIGIIPIKTEPPPAEYKFSAGAWIESAEQSEIAWRTLDVIPSWRSVSEEETFGLTTATGALLLRRDHEYEKPDDMVAAHQRLRNELRTLRWCIDLAGCGQNRIWITTGVHNCAVYLHCPAMPSFDTPWRMPFIYRTPTAERRDASWSEERLREADELFDAAMALNVDEPRLNIANRFRRVACTLSGRDMTARFQLTVSALETFYIAPDETKYLWSHPIPDRIQQVVSREGLSIPDKYFGSLNETRNNAVHRGGLDRHTWKRPSYYDVHCWSEDILAATLRWAFKNAVEVARCFRVGKWVL